MAFSVFLSGQNMPVYDTLNINFQWVSFFCNGSVQKYTKFIDDNGILTFQEGYIDADELDETIVRHVFLKDGTVKSFIKKFHFIEGVDTIYNYFSSNNYSCEQAQNLVFNKLIGSYVLKESGYQFNQIRSDEILSPG